MAKKGAGGKTGIRGWKSQIKSKRDDDDDRM